MAQHFSQSLNVLNGWTTEMEAKLIEKVKKRSCLWNRCSPYYRMVKLRKITYLKICEELQKKYPSLSLLFTPDELQKKFNSLRSRYRAELKDSNKINESGCFESDYTPEWPHFDRLRFLDKNIDDIKSESGLTPSMIDLIDDDDEPDAQEYCQVVYDRVESTATSTPVSTDTRRGSSEQRTKRECEPTTPAGVSTDAQRSSVKRLRFSDSLDETVDSETSINIPSVSNINDDHSSSYAFGQLIASKLMSISDAKKQQKVEIKLLELINRYVN